MTDRKLPIFPEQVLPSSSLSSSSSSSPRLNSNTSVQASSLSHTRTDTNEFNQYLQRQTHFRAADTNACTITTTKEHRRSIRSLGRVIRKKCREQGGSPKKKENLAATLISVLQLICGIVAPEHNLDFIYSTDGIFHIKGLRIDEEELSNIRVCGEQSLSSTRTGPLSLPRIFPTSIKIESGDDSENHGEEKFVDSWSFSDEKEEETEEEVIEEGGTGSNAARPKIILFTQPMKTIHGSLVESLPEVLPPELKDISKTTQRYKLAGRIITSLCTCDRQSLESKFEFLKTFRARLFCDASWKHFTNNLPQIPDQNAHGNNIRTYTKLVRWYGWTVHIEHSQTFLLFLHRFYIAKTVFDLCDERNPEEKYNQFSRIFKTGNAYSSIPGLNMRNKIRKLWYLVVRTLQLVDLIGAGVLLADCSLKIMDLDIANYLRVVDVLKSLTQEEKEKFNFNINLAEGGFKDLILK
ncbi:hypothetical protein BKA69DRAFT_1125015 [Paraphysoderma sedebokerense]|nr:hypothetical protein BKA69DRAFT_1125015 [Paraphysoderma sedebokerense]